MKKQLMAAAVAFVLAAPSSWAALSPVDLNADSQIDGYLDSTSNVVWYLTADVAGAMRYSAANTWATSQSFAGLVDWRLPTLDELDSLYNTLGNVDGAMKPGGFNNVTPGQYWSTTRSGSNIYGLDIRTGSQVTHVDNGASLYGWAVHAPLAAVPEPASALLMLAGLAVLYRVVSRRAWNFRRGDPTAA